MPFSINHWITFSTWLSFLLLIVAPSVAQISDVPEKEPIGYLNWPTKTLGGRQFWSDVRCVGGWKIQRHSNTGHHRLIRPDWTRMAWGNLAHCEQELEKRIGAGEVVPHSGKLVIVLHGLVRTSNSMAELGNYLKKHGEFQTINFEYASTRQNVERHARDLKSVIDGLGDGVTEINFVGHSLGNIVVRRYLHGFDGTDRPDPRINRMVMLGPPNQGSRVATIFKGSLLFKTISGACGAQLGGAWENLEPQLAVPDFEFGIIAGGQAQETDWNNILLEGPDDFTVSVEEAKLSGASDLKIAPLLHSTMMKQPSVLEWTLSFLQHGYFESPEKREPIPADWKPSP